MTATIARHGPDQIIAIPQLRKPTNSRWVVLLWREPARARFSHYREGRIEVDHQAAWGDCHWGAPLPEVIPAHLAARAHRQLRQLQRTSDRALSTPAQRLASLQQKRRSRATTKPARLLRP